jgi:hypothetical protein
MWPKYPTHAKRNLRFFTRVRSGVGSNGDGTAGQVCRSVGLVCDCPIARILGALDDCDDHCVVCGLPIKSAAERTLSGFRVPKVTAVTWNGQTRASVLEAVEGVVP